MASPSSSALLLTYFMTSSPVFVRRMQNTIRQQLIFDAIHGASDFPRALITDLPETDLPGELKEYFSHNIWQSKDPHVLDPHTGLLECCHNLMRNKCIDVALDSGCDWMMFCDVDTVVVKGNGFTLPRMGHGQPRLYRQKAALETIDESFVRIVQRRDESIFTNGNSWFILGRPIFSEIRANESMYGYGYEDWEFNSRIHSFDRNVIKPELFIIHIYHPEDEKGIKDHLLARNKAIWNSTCALLAFGLQQHEIPAFEVAEIKSGPLMHLCIAERDRLAIDASRRRIGRIDDISRPDRLVVNWNDGVSIFTRENGIWHERK